MCRDELWINKWNLVQCIVACLSCLQLCSVFFHLKAAPWRTQTESVTVCTISSYILLPFCADVDPGRVTFVQHLFSPHLLIDPLRRLVMSVFSPPWLSHTLPLHVKLTVTLITNIQERRCTLLADCNTSVFGGRKSSSQHSVTDVCEWESRQVCCILLCRLMKLKWGSFGKIVKN